MIQISSGYSIQKPVGPPPQPESKAESHPQSQVTKGQGPAYKAEPILVMSAPVRKWSKDPCL